MVELGMVCKEDGGTVLALRIDTGLERTTGRSEFSA
jgi:hypothetical protein